MVQRATGTPNATPGRSPGYFQPLARCPLFRSVRPQHWRSNHTRGMVRPRASSTMGLFNLFRRGARKSEDVGGYPPLAGDTALLVPVLSSPAVRYSGPCDWSDYMDAVPVWRLAQEAWAKAIGVELPDYRTRREFEEARAKCEAALVACQKFATQPAPAIAETSTTDEPDDNSPIVVKARILPPKDAAELFLADLRAIGETGPYDNDQMRTLYLEHCTRYDLEPAPENFMREALETMPGIWKKQFNNQCGVGGKRTRKFKWMISTDERAAA